MEDVSGQEVYVGPRPFRTGQKLYGRNRETAELVSLLISQRLVLLHSPSGAGKTSLIQAKLVPAMQKRRFELPINQSEEELIPQPVIIRVNREPEEEDLAGSNRYVLSLVLSLESRLPEKKRRSVAELATYTIDQYLEEAFPAASREASSESAEGEGFRPLLLIFDQLEELLTLDPTDPEKKKEFMTQLGESLRNQGRWALFAIREDFLGSFEPYLSAIPTRLAATYHLGLLKAEVAAEAIREPAEAVGVAFQDEVVKLLIDDLRQVRVQEPGGTFQLKAGPYVEPVHLQVVCQTLWTIKEDAQEITPEHLEILSRGHGTGVDEVLAGYYARRVELAAKEGDVSERLIRDWFGKKLIGVQLVRLPILVNEAFKFGLSPECLDVLDKSFLIRRENRSGAQWYELAHDRLMTPVANDNEIWRTEHLSTFQIQAELWQERGRPVNLLLSGNSLKEAEEEPIILTSEATQVEKDYIERSVAARDEALAREVSAGQSERIKLMRRRIYWGSLMLGLLTVAVIIAVAKSGYATYQTGVAEAAEKQAKKEKLKAEWQAYGGKIAQAQTEWKRGNVRLAREYLTSCSEEFRGWEYQYLEDLFNQDRKALIGHSASVTGLSFNASGTRVASSSIDQTVKVWDVIDRRLITTLNGNADWVNSVAFSPSGEFLATGGDDFSVRIWRFEKGKDKPVESLVLGWVQNWDGEKYDQSLGGHRDAVSCVTFTSDNRWIVSGSEDMTLKIWATEGEGTHLVRTLEGHEGAVTSVSTSPDGKWISSGSKDSTVRIWNLETGEIHKTFRASENPVTCLSYSPDGNWVASGGEDPHIYLWDLRKGEDQRPQVIDGHTGGVTCIAFNSDGTRIASGDWNGVLREWIWMPESSEHQKDFTRNVHTGIVNSIAYRPARRVTLPSRETAQNWLLASGGADCLVKFLDSAEKTPEAVTLRDHNGLVWSVDVSPDGENIVSGSEDKMVKIWARLPIDSWGFDLTITTENTIPQEGRNLITVAPVKNGLNIRIFDEKGEIVFEEVKKLRLESGISELEALFGQLSSDRPEILVPDDIKDQVLKTAATKIGYERYHWVTVAALQGHDWEVWSVDYSPDGKSIVSAGKDGRVIIWDAKKGSEQTPVIFDGHSGPVLRAVFSPDGEWIASGSADKTVKLWKVSEGAGQIPITLEGHEKWVSSVDFTPDGHWLVSSSADATLKIWDLTQPDKGAVQTLEGHTGPVQSVSISHDGESILSGSDDKTIRLWERKTGEHKMTLNGHTAWVTSVNFGPEGSKRIVSGSQDNTVKLWDLTTGQNTLTLDEHNDTVWRVVFSPDGKRIVSCSQDWTIKLWELQK